MFFIFKQDIECSQRPVDPCDVLLKIYLVVVTELFMGIDILLQHSQPVAKHYDLVKEDVNGNFFWLLRLISRL